MESPSAPQSAPPPLPVYKAPFAIKAARLSLWMPFLGLAVGLLGAGRHLVLTGLAVLLLIVGAALGVVALCNTSQHGSSRILGRAVTGIVLNVIFAIGLAAALIVGVRSNNQKSLASVNQEIRNVQADMRKSLESGEGLQDDPERMESIKKAFEKGSNEATGDAKLILKAGAGYAEKVELAGQGYHAALKALEESGVVDTSTIAAKEDIQARRELVQTFITENDKFKTFLSDLENVFLAELRKQIPNNEKIVQQALAGYHSKAKTVNPLLVKIRGTDDQIGQAMLGILDVLEKNWGTWTSEDDGPLFEEDTAIDEYNVHFEKLQAAASEQEALQRKLLSAQR